MAHQPNHPRPYKFTEVRPPLLKENEDIRAIPAADLEEQIGSVSWQVDRDYTLPEPNVDITRNLNLKCHDHIEYTAKRFKRWQLSDAIHTFGQKETIQVTEKRGCSQSEKKTFEQTMSEETGLDLKIYFLGFSANVKQSLNITEQVETSWTYERIDVITKEYEAGTKFAPWQLIDVIELTGTIHTTQMHWDNVLRVKYDTPITRNIFTVLDIYEDEVKINTVNSYNQLLRRIFATAGEFAELSPSALREDGEIKHPCTICDCKDFVELDGRVDCAQKDCGHSVFDHD
jgi:hypothetical protein